VLGVPLVQTGPRPPVPVQAERQQVQAERQPVPVAGQVWASSPPLAQQGRLSAWPTLQVRVARSAAGPQAEALGLTPV
jgi:hypothetical protein